MSQPEEHSQGTAISHPRFAAYYERQSQGRAERRFMEPLRRELVEQAHGLVLEVGAGTGLNFAFYLPARVERVAALEPDPAMLAYAQSRLSLARVPLSLDRASAETLPFTDGYFDCALATLVFCSVSNPARAFQELRRVLRPGGTLLLLEHVRSRRPFAASIQNMLVPLTTRMAGNCHWNRDTMRVVQEAGFQIEQERLLNGGLLPILLLRATR